MTQNILNSSHWGAFEPVVIDGRVTETRSFTEDPDPSPLLGSIPDALYHRCRVMRRRSVPDGSSMGPADGVSGVEPIATYP